MALFKNEATSSMADLISKLNTFLTTAGAGNPGWTADVHDAGNGRWAISKNDGGSQDVEVAFQWDTTTPNALGIYQYHTGLGAGNYNSGGGTVPYDQDGDSGNGAASTTDATLLTARHADIGDTPLQYWCFVGDTYVHIVVETAADVFAHFGFGVLNKFNDWTGGEYCYGQKFQGGTNNTVAMQARSTTLLDGYSTGTSPDAMQFYVATVHCEGMTDTPTSGLWAIVSANQSTIGNDRQGTPRARIQFLGGFRAGANGTPFGDFIGTITLGHVPTYPIVCYHWDRDISGSSTQSGSIAIMGAMKDVRGVNMRNFLAGDTVTIGSDTWHLFPSRKRWATGALNETSAYQGIMYKEN